MSGMTNCRFAGVAEGEPNEIRAHEDCIVMGVPFGENDIREVVLRPRHILAAVDMADDWWDSHWAAVHEERA